MSSDEWRKALTGNELSTVKSLASGDPELLARPIDGVSPMMQALYHRATDVAAWLRDYAIELTVHEAAALGDVEALERILSADPACINEHARDGFMPLHLAAFFGHPRAVTLLLANGAEVNAIAENPTRVRPLHSAVASRHTTAVHAILDAGPDVNAKQAGGFTALHAAALHGDEAMVALLLEARADTSIAADDGRTAADFAREGGFDALAGKLG